MTVRAPSKKTLARYGLSIEEWAEILSRQDGVCAVCKKLPKSLLLHIDHAHVRGWKKMPPEKRRLWVRGLLCWFCNNSYVGRSITIKKAEAVVTYLKEFESRLVLAGLIG